MNKYVGRYKKKWHMENSASELGETLDLLTKMQAKV